MRASFSPFSCPTRAGSGTTPRDISKPPKRQSGPQSRSSILQRPSVCWIGKAELHPFPGFLPRSLGPRPHAAARGHPHQEGGWAPRRLGESDYLLGVYDKNRMGTLRFRERGSEVFQSADSAMATPSWSTLRDLEYASFLAEHEEDDEKLDPWLAMLIAPGSSLEGEHGSRQA